jgi:hypothetical protein
MRSSGKSSSDCMRCRRRSWRCSCCAGNPGAPPRWREHESKGSWALSPVPIEAGHAAASV